MNNNSIIDEKKIYSAIASYDANRGHVRNIDLRSCIRDILEKAVKLEGLTLEETAMLLSVKNHELQTEIFDAARQTKNDIYGSRIVLFAPLYISNHCSNNCIYCAFRSANKNLQRRALQQNEIMDETRALLKQGHKRLLMVSGANYPNNDFDYILQAIQSIYSARLDGKQTNNIQSTAIRRVNVNLAPLTLDEFKELKKCNIGTYQLFQETYDKEIYSKVHLDGKKADYAWRLTAMDRAIQAGIDDIGIGVLFGLADWRFDVLALLQHANYLKQTYGAGPHTISVPRLEPANGSEFASNPFYPISDNDFCMIISVLRLAVPYTGIILSTRENPSLRRLALGLGVSQISAGSRTNPGGYTDNSLSNNKFDSGQFSLGDHRSLDEVVQDIATLGYIPSFCTACYRSGRTGEDFMCLAEHRNIKNMCFPNALITFMEYLIDHASPETRFVGEKLIHHELANLPMEQNIVLKKILDNLRNGARDLFI